METYPLKETMNILILDDDPLWLFNLRKRMPKNANVYEARNPETAGRLLKSKQIDLAIIDLDVLCELDGLEVVSVADSLNIYSIILTSHTEEEIIKSGYKEGAKDYLNKPISDEALSQVFNKFNNFRAQNKKLENVAERFFTRDPATIEILKKVGRLGQSSKAVLLQGPSGTGKTHLAKIIHDQTNHNTSPFIEINCAQFNEMTIDSELFGHKKGSFTGAHEDKQGLVKSAEGGTLFLDEIHGLSSKAQLKLLTALDQGIIYPMGSNKAEHVNFKIICATSENLEELVDRGVFRRDLYFRVRTFIINLKGLKDRKCDVIPLIERSLKKFERKVYISPEAKVVLENFTWPGNVREINDLVENWNTFGVGIVSLDELPSKMKMNKAAALCETSAKASSTNLDEVYALGLKGYLDKIKEDILCACVEKHGGKQVDAAKALRISKSQMSKEMTKVRNNGIRG